LDTVSRPPRVTLEIYRVGDGLAARRAFTWNEVLGVTKIKPLPQPIKEDQVKSEAAKPKGKETEQ
ncbi:MAG TPA: hypothetical protein VEO53_18340, partial [Candidatus Binatia bacterium]|nr:hypothetical protein [Candidatus Binatia bacterium]